MATEKRMIDANFLDNRCRQQISDDWNKKVAPVSWSEAYKEFLDDVWDAPTVDAEEVVHGEWTIMENDYDGTTTLECSVCEMSFCFEEYDGLLPQSQTYHFCPNCGAKMDGDGDG